MAEIKSTFLLRRGPLAEWTSVNPVLKQGEPGIAVDANILKVGDGTTAWNSLPEIGGDASVGGDGKSIVVNNKVFAIKGFSDAVAGTVPSKGADGNIEWIVPQGRVYTAGANVQISTDNVISATDTIYNDTEVRGLITAEALARNEADANLQTSKQNKLTAGANITINADTIAATDTKLATAITLGKQITATQAVGGISAGKVYSADTTLAQIIEDLLGGTAPVGDKKIYTKVASDVPTSVSSMTSITTTKEALLANYVWKNITANNEYVCLAIDKSIGLSCYKIEQNGFGLGYNTVDLGEQILYVISDKITDTGMRLTYYFEEE